MQVEDECNNGEGRLDGLGAVFVGLVELVAEVVDRLLVAFAQTRLRRLVLHRHQLEVLLHLLHLVLATTTDLRLTAHDARVCVCFTANKSDRDLFCKLCVPTHALNHLLPPARNRASLRTRGHSYQLPEYSTDLHKKSVLIRSLYSFVKWNSFYSFFGFAALYCTSFWLCFLCLLFDVHLSHLINITYIQ